MSSERILSEVELQQISQLVYLDVLDSQGMNTDLSLQYRDGGNQISLGQLIDYYTTDPEGIQKIKERFNEDLNGQNQYNYWMEFLGDMNTKEYRDWKISDVVSNNQQNESGFVAFTVEPKKGTKIVAFRGSEPMSDPLYRNDWKNNATTAYALESWQQEDARKYIEALYKKGGIKELYLTGHSLGGNLALYATFVLPESLRQHLVTTSTFNAPGFNNLVLDKYAQVINELVKEGKIKEFQNFMDFVPALFKNPTKGILLDSISEEAGRGDNHSMFLLAKGQDGTFRRADSQERDGLIKFIHHLTMGFEAYPTKFKEGLIGFIFRVWDREMTYSDIIIAVSIGLSAVLAPLPTLMAALGFAATTYLIGFIKEEIIPWIKKGWNTLVDKVESFVHKAKEYFAGLVDNAVKAAKLFGREVLDFVDRAKKSIADFFTKAKQTLKNVIQYTLEQVDKAREAWKNLKEKISAKFTEIKDSVITKIKHEKDKFVENVKGFKAKLGQLTGKIKAKLTKGVKALVQAATGGASGPKIRVSLQQLQGLQRSLRRSEERIGDLVRRALSLTSRVTSDVGRRYHEYYVQAQLRQIQRLTDQIQKESRRVSESLQNKSKGVKYAVSKYKEVEIKLRAYLK